MPADTDPATGAITADLRLVHPLGFPYSATCSPHIDNIDITFDNCNISNSPAHHSRADIPCFYIAKQ